EFGMLTEEEKKKAAELAVNAGSTYLKNSSGWGKAGKATLEDITLLREIANKEGKVEVKPPGEVRNFEDAKAILDAGSILIGTSGGVKIVTGEGESKSDY